MQKGQIKPEIKQENVVFSGSTLAEQIRENNFAKKT